MNQQIFAYCERGLDTAFWAEPINAVTNVAFLIAAGVALAHWAAIPKATAGRGLFELGLVIIVAIIGIGSFLFHTYATRWAAMADVLPITVFMLAYLGYALRRFCYAPWWGVALGLAVFVFALTQAREIRCDGGPCFNGSVGYFPAFIALILIGSWLVVRAHPAGGSLIAAGLIFAVSLTFRSLDQALCPWTRINGLDPIGLHFMWHVLNGTLLYVLLRAAILHGHRRSALAAA